jgi:hypothetical protein
MIPVFNTDPTAKERKTGFSAVSHQRLVLLGKNKRFNNCFPLPAGGIVEPEPSLLSFSPKISPLKRPIASFDSAF